MSSVKYCSNVPYIPTCSQQVLPANCLTNFGCNLNCYDPPVPPVQGKSLEWLTQTQYQSCCPNTQRQCESDLPRELPVPFQCVFQPLRCDCPPEPSPCADPNPCDDDDTWIELCNGGVVRSKADVAQPLQAKQPFKPKGGCASCGGNTY